MVRGVPFRHVLRMQGVTTPQGLSSWLEPFFDTSVGNRGCRGFASDVIESIVMLDPIANWSQEDDPVTSSTVSGSHQDTTNLILILYDQIVRREN